MQADAPRLTPSMRSALTDLGLNRLWVVYPGEQAYRLAENVEVIPASLLADDKGAAFLDR
ncbi:MAG: hypothetical protein C0394_11000 [Syntrophus sp. (in: bacteria)]|nr:hypothetical protein [Syntrophus sp. (in: bacteria)]